MKKNRIDTCFGATSCGPLELSEEHSSSVWDSLFSHSLDEACTELARRLSFGSSGAAVAFLNLHNYVACQGTTPTVFAGFDFLFGDGVGLQVAKLFISAPPFHRISGTDLVPALLNYDRCPPLRVFLLGGERHIVAGAAARFPGLFPRHHVVGHHPGHLAPSEDNLVIEMINACQPNLLLIGMGTPSQEKWLTRHRDRMEVRVSICVGGLFHYWHGDLKRAGRGLRRVGLEWLWILMQQPYKWRRYTTEPWKLLWQLLKIRWGQRTWS